MLALIADAPSAMMGAVIVVESVLPILVIVLLMVSHFLPNSSSDFPAAVHSDFAVLSSLLQAAISACV